MFGGRGPSTVDVFLGPMTVDVFLRFVSGNIDSLGSTKHTVSLGLRLSACSQQENKVLKSPS